MARANLMFVFAVAGVVLLIACQRGQPVPRWCANRRQEMTVRRARRGRARLIRQLLSESLMLAATGAAAGLALAWWAKDALPRMLEDDVILDTAIDVTPWRSPAG